MKELFKEIKQYVTPCNLAIIIITILVYILQTVSGFRGGNVTEILSLAWWKVFNDREYYRLFTYMFLHGNVMHLFNNMLVLGFVGSTVERLMGSFRYLVNYLCSGFVAGLVSIAYNRWLYGQAIAGTGHYVYSLGASGAVFGMAGALLWIIVAGRGRVQGISVRQIGLFIILSVYAGIADSGIDNAAHIAGVLFGTVSAMILYNRRGGFA